MEEIRELAWVDPLEADGTIEEETLHHATSDLGPAKRFLEWPLFWKCAHSVMHDPTMLDIPTPSHSLEDTLSATDPLY